MYTVSYVRQYDNASVVQLLIDWDEQQEQQLTIQQKLQRNHFGLYIDESYECRSKGTGGSNGHESSTYVVTPPLPDDLRGLHFVLQNTKMSLKKSLQDGLLPYKVRGC